MILSVSDAHAEVPQYGIALSKTCYNMVSNGMRTDCPTYEEIMTVFPDGTDPKIAGDFKMIKGLLQRDTPAVKNPWNYYRQFGKSVIWIDPPGDTRNHLRMLYIEPSIKEFKIGDESIRMNDYDVKFGKDRWMNENCSEIKVTAKNWLFTLGDGMRLLQHNCDMSFTQFNGTVTHKFEKSYQDITTSSKYKLDEMVKIAKEKYKKSFIGSLEQGINRQVIEDENE